MIVAERKPLEEIKEMIKDARKVLVLGCGGCTSICLSGGQKEVELLMDDLKVAFKADHLTPTLHGHTIERQCNGDFYPDLDERVPSYDALLSMACGAGVQFLADRYPTQPTFPALNTIFVGVDREIGWYEENCRSCGECILGETAGICPVTRCAKSIFNGPCGGTSPDGKGEVNNDTPCAWYEIYDRLQRQNRLDQILRFNPPREWRNQTRRNFIHEVFKSRYAR